MLLVAGLKHILSGFSPVAGAFFDFAATELVGLFGSGIRARLRPLVQTGWGRDPFALGSYSYALPGHADARAALAAPVDGRLFFAGEACSRHDFTTAHGAYLTGIEAADEVIALMPRGTCTRRSNSRPRSGGITRSRVAE
jgi:monoamine oxidase